MNCSAIRNRPVTNVVTIKVLIVNFYLVGEKNTIGFIIFSGINPRIAVEMESSMAGNVLERDGFEKEFTKMFISDKESSWNSKFFIPIKCNTEGCFSCKYWDYCIGNPILQVSFLSNFPLKMFSCFVREKRKPESIT